MFSGLSVCLFVCLSAKSLKKHFIENEIFGGVEEAKEKWFDFCVDPDSFVDPGSFSRIPYY